MKGQGSRDDQWWSKYNAYLLTQSWKSKRAKVLKRAAGVCEGCGSSKATQVHHLNYKHVFNEFLFDLVAVCEECHERIHAKDKKTPAFDHNEWSEGFACEGCRWQDEENHVRWCGKFQMYARVALAEGGDCGPWHKELEPLK